MEILRTLRKEKGMTQQELAELLDVSRNTIVLYENGKQSPSRKMLIRIAALFECSVDELLCGNINPKRNVHLIEVRQQCGDTVEKVSTAINVSKEQYLKWENGIEEIDSVSLEKLSRYFGVSTGYILGHYDDMKKALIKEQTDYISLIEVIQSGKSKRKLYNKLTPYGKEVFLEFLLMGNEELESAKLTAKLLMSKAERDVLVHDEFKYYLENNKDDEQ